MQSQPHLCSLATSEASLLFPPPLCLRGRAGGGGSLEPIIEKGRSGGRRSGIGIAELQQTQQTGCLPWHRLDPRLPATMAPGSLSWLLSWATLCHLTMLLAGTSVGSGQQHGVKKCIFTCNKMTSEIHLHRLVRYQRNQESCDKPAIIFETKGHRNFCADPKERWVQEAMEHLDRQAAVTTQNGGTFEKQIGLSEPRTAPVTRGVDRSAVSEPKATEESSSQEAQRALGTSPELLMGAAGFWGTTSLSTSKPPDAGVPAGPKKTELLNTAAVTTATSWQSSAASQPESGLWAEGKSSEGPSTQAPSTQTPSTQAPSTQTLLTRAPSTQTPSTQTPSTQTLPTQAPSTQTLPTQAPSTQTLSTQAPTVSHTAQEDSVGPEGQSVSVKRQNLMPENSLGSMEMDPISAHTEAFRGPGSMPHVSLTPVFSDGAPSREPVASGSWAPKAKEPIHATVDPQRLGIIITPVPDSQAATRRQAVGLLAFLGLLFCLGVAMFAYQSFQSCPHKLVGDVVERLHYIPRSCASNSYVLVPV
ncbi:fractalkine isoform X1 [Equus caballus]|uniref:fractalkine isoform X1 n=1 Tax=Equus caballus TaxID=9796 RepID=UPI0038B32EBD